MSFKCYSNKMGEAGDFVFVTGPLRYRLENAKAAKAASEWAIAADVLKEHTPELYDWLQFMVKYTRTIKFEEEV